MIAGTRTGGGGEGDQRWTARETRIVISAPNGMSLQRAGVLFFLLLGVGGSGALV
jgi:hypothetical protein